MVLRIGKEDVPPPSHDMAMLRHGRILPLVDGRQAPTILGQFRGLL
jgi:hypothetical protein